MNPETLPPLPTLSEEMETELLTPVPSEETTDSALPDDTIDYEILRVFYGAGF